MVGRQGGSPVDFTPLSDDAWKSLREIGTLRVEPITFQAGGELLDETGKEQVDKIAALLINNYPGYRIAVRGHTGAGDEEENRKLSLQSEPRWWHSISSPCTPSMPDRLHAEGKGASQPLARKPGESERALPVSTSQSGVRAARGKCALAKGDPRVVGTPAGPAHKPMGSRLSIISRRPKILPRRPCSAPSCRRRCNTRPRSCLRRWPRWRRCGVWPLT